MIHIYMHQSQGKLGIKKIAQTWWRLNLWSFWRLLNRFTVFQITTLEDNGKDVVFVGRACSQIGVWWEDIDLDFALIRWNQFGLDWVKFDKQRATWQYMTRLTWHGHGLVAGCHQDWPNISEVMAKYQESGSSSFVCFFFFFITLKTVIYTYEIDVEYIQFDRYSRHSGRSDL